VVVADGKRCDLKTAREVWKTLMISGPSCGPALFYDVCFLKSLTGRFRGNDEKKIDVWWCVCGGGGLTRD
jgi:hypothetical protein